MTVIQKRIYLEPEYLDDQIDHHIKAKIEKMCLHECTKEHGYILSVNNIISYENIEETIFLVKFDATTLLPLKGEKFTGTICLIFKDGILINIKNKQKMLIPALNLKNYKYDEIENVYVNDQGKLKLGDTIQAIVNASKYINHSFSCFGSIV